MNIRKRAAGLLLAVLMVLLCSLSVFAEENYSVAFYRPFDTTGELTKAERTKLDGQFIEFMETYGLDLGIASITEETLGQRTLDEFSALFFERSELGYGENKDGIVGIYQAESGTLSLFFFGNARERVSEEYQKYVEGYAPTFREKYSIHGVMYSTMSLLKKGLEGDDAGIQAIGSAEAGIDADILESQTFTIGGIPRWGEESPEHPYWYPKDTDSFEFYQDAEAPRVLDTAGIFSEETEAEMEAQIAAIRQKYGKDIVVAAVPSTCGMAIEQYAADFYDYCGYGFGDQREGICLVICMDPEDRGGWTCTTGEECMKLFSARNSDRLDDVLYGYLGSEEYEAGILDWIHNIGELFRTGLAIAPDWFPDGGIAPTDYFNENAPRVVDECQLLTEEELEALKTFAASIRETYGIDPAVHIVQDTLSMTEEHFNAFFFNSMGYGIDGSRSGILLSLFPNDNMHVSVNVYGAAANTVSSSQAKQIRDRMRWSSGGYKKADAGLAALEHLLEKGWVPKSPGFWILTVLLGGGAAMAYGFYREIRSSGSGTGFHAGGRRYGRSRTRHYSSHSSYSSYSSSGSSSSRSSSGSSSRSSGYSGSSGSSHSGSGRKF